MHDINRIFGKLLFSTEEEVRFIANHSTDSLERALARFLLLLSGGLTLDYEGQKREKNGQFGKGKKPKSASNTHQKASSQKNQEENRGKTQKAENHEKEENRAKPVSPKAKTNSGGNISEEYLRKALMSSPKEDLNGIQRHIQNEAWVKQRDEALRNGDLPKSCFIISEKRIRSLVKNRLKAGDFETIIARRSDSRAIMRFKEPIGEVFVKRDEGKICLVKTRLLCIVYSHKHGYHFFPVEED